MKRKILWLLVSSLIVMALVLASCGPAAEEEVPAKPTVEEKEVVSAPEGPQYGGTLTIGLGVDFSSLDPNVSTSGTDVGILNIIYDPVFYPTTDFKPIREWSPVESWEYPDDTTILWHIRKGMKFHDGTTYNANAVKFNIDRMMQEGSPRKGYFVSVESVEVTGEYTAVLHMKSVDAVLVANLMHFAGFFASPTAVEKWGDEYMLHPVGSGPCQLAEIRRGVEYTLERYEDYWNKDNFYFDKIIFKVIPDSTVRFAALQVGEIDVLMGATAKDQIKVKDTGEFQLAQGGATPAYILFNSMKEPFIDKNIRMAVSFAINNEVINDTINYGLGLIPTQPLSPTIWGQDESLVSLGKQYGFDYDPEKSKELLTEAGYPNGFKFTAIVYSSETMSNLSEAVKGYLDEVGIEMELDILDIGALAGRQTKGEYEALISTWTPPRDPSTQLFLMNHSLGPWQGGRFVDADLDRFLLAAQSTYDVEERTKAYTEAQKVMIENCYDVYLPFMLSTNLVSNKVHDYKLWATGVWYPLGAWMEQ